MVQSPRPSQDVRYLPRVNSPLLLSIVGIVIALAVGVPGLVLAFISLNRSVEVTPAFRELTIDLLSESVFPRDLRLREFPIEVTYDDRSVQQLLVAQVAVQNTGDATIRPEDFFQNPSLAVRDGHFVAAKVDNVRPPEKTGAVEAAWRLTATGTFDLTPLPLEAGDLIFLTLVGELDSETFVEATPTDFSVPGVYLEASHVTLSPGVITDVEIKFRTVRTSRSSTSTLEARRFWTADRTWAFVASALATAIGTLLFGLSVFVFLRRRRARSTE